MRAKSTKPVRVLRRVYRPADAKRVLVWDKQSTMKRGWLWVGAVSAAGLIGAAVWIVDAEKGAADEEELLAADEADPRPARGKGRAAKGATRSRPGNAIERIEALEKKVDALERELVIVRASSGLSARIAEAGDDIARTEDPVFEGAVREIIETDRKEAQEAEMERRRERFAEMIDESANELAQKAGLDADRRDGIAALWQTEMEKVMPLFMAARSGDRSFSEVREEIDAVRASTDAEAKKLLDESQQALYDELRPRGRRDGRDRGRPGRPD